MNTTAGKPEKETKPNQQKIQEQANFGDQYLPIFKINKTSSSFSPSYIKTMPDFFFC